MVSLGGPDKPVALQKSDEKVPAKASPETAKQGGVRQMEAAIEEQHAYKVLWSTKVLRKIKHPSAYIISRPSTFFSLRCSKLLQRENKWATEEGVQLAGKSELLDQEYF